MDKIIKYTDPFLGEIELKKVGEVIVSSYHDTFTCYTVETDRFKKRGLDCGIYYRYNSEKIQWMSGNQAELISRIYDKLTRIE
jgi:hypothetical protein